ncbi:hypothetical protein C8F01DRAFT_1369250 [Mycena amicta]|nr:hypothetical protein C8F01DRAFT_1369250 [Mycena amicta]
MDDRDHTPDISPLLAVLTRALQEAQRQNASLCKQLQDAGPSRFESRELREREASLARAERDFDERVLAFKQQTERIGQEMSVLAEQRDIAVRERDEAQQAWKERNSDALATNTALCVLLQEHEDLKKAHRFDFSKSQARADKTIAEAQQEALAALQIRQRDTQSEDIQRQLDAETARADRAERFGRESQNRTDRLAGQLAVAETSIAKLTADGKHATTRNEDLERVRSFFVAFAMSEYDCQILAATKQELEKSEVALKERMSEFQANTLLLQERIQTSDTLRVQITHLERAEQTLKKENVDLATDNIELRVKLQMWTKEERAQKDREENSKEECNHLRNALERKSVEAEEHLARITELERQLQALPAPISQAVKEEDVDVYMQDADHPPTMSEAVTTAESPNRAPNASAERKRYLGFMAPFVRPSARESFDSLRPVATGYTASSMLRSIPSEFTREILFLPHRTIWCTRDKVHALGFAPTMIFNPATRKWAPDNSVNSLCGTTVDLFVQEASDVHYAGVYLVHDMRKLHPPGSIFPQDISFTGVMRAMGLSGRQDPDGSDEVKLYHDRLRELYPDGRPRTECFGLQCVGFDDELYRVLVDNPTQLRADRYRPGQDRDESAPRREHRRGRARGRARKRKAAAAVRARERSEEEEDEDDEYGRRRRSPSRRRVSSSPARKRKRSESSSSY